MTPMTSVVLLPATLPGRYTFRATYDYPEKGTDGGKEYTIVRYHTTLAVDVPK